MPLGGRFTQISLPSSGGVLNRIRLSRLGALSLIGPTEHVGRQAFIDGEGRLEIAHSRVGIDTGAPPINGDVKLAIQAGHIRLDSGYALVFTSGDEIGLQRNTAGAEVRMTALGGDDELGIRKIGGASGERIVIGDYDAANDKFKLDCNGQTIEIFVNANDGQPSAKFLSDSRFYSTVPDSAPTDANLDNSQMTFYLDEASNALKVRVRYSDGTLKTGTVALT